MMDSAAESLQKTVMDLTQRVPKELKKFHQWVAWRSVLKPNGKISKVPINPKNGLNASPTNPGHWGTYSQALSYYFAHRQDGISGIGFVFTPHDPFCGVDLDDCWDPELKQVKSPFLKKVLDDLNSYTEVSPSGKGLKVFLKGKLPGCGRKFGNIEMYDSGRYFTVTGQRLPGYSSIIEDRKAQIVELYNRLSNPKSNHPRKVGSSG